MSELLNFKIISTENESSSAKRKTARNSPIITGKLNVSDMETMSDTHKVTSPIKYFNIISNTQKSELESHTETYSVEKSVWHKHLIENNIEFQTITENFLNMIRNDNFESGYSSTSEVFFKSMLSEDPKNTRNWLNSVYLKYFYDTKILVGILHIISHIDYEVISPEGPTMAVASLIHEDVEVREYALKAFENWENPDSLSILRNINCRERWLQEYLEDIIRDLEEE